MSSTSNSSSSNDLNRRFLARVESAVQTAKAWDADTQLLAKCRAMIPTFPLDDDCSHLVSPNARYLLGLARYFKSQMTWVNNPPCEHCALTETSLQTVRGPETVEEREGDASRVEVYVCDQCRQVTTFPRYNKVRKLLETQRGRCGEYANLFGLYCRAVGLETRYVLDWTDHVWTECNVDGQWIMVDSCEGVVCEPSMYEAGWGKHISYVVAASKNHVVDVTPRYTRKFCTEDFQARRRAITTSEIESEQILRQLNRSVLQANLASNVREDLVQRLESEQVVLQKYKSMTTWPSEYSRGRISGSLVWKVQRSEAGKKGSTANEKDSARPTQFQIETFFPTPNMTKVTIFVNPRPAFCHDGIVISGAGCSMGFANSLSVVVVDQEYLGCILQSRSFTTTHTFAQFINSLPTGRILVVQGRIPQASGIQLEEIYAGIARLGGFDASLIPEGILFAGQVGFLPGWAFCSSFSAEANGRLILASQPPVELDRLKLSRYANTRPASVVGRLPDKFMSLAAQLCANNDQKNVSFRDYLATTGNGSRVSGYTTKAGSPVYLLGGCAYPLERVEPSSATDPRWSTYLLLPSPIAPDDEVSEASVGVEPTTYDIPIDVDFFTQCVGWELLTKQSNGVAVAVDTVTSLHQARLVGFYFSAHWCGPCRSFTPMLVEMYERLKRFAPSHGLEIIFVSSDRDRQSFDRYYGSMPWLSIPFDSLAPFKASLSSKYGVQGLPSLVIIDSLSGQTVSSAGTSRNEVARACSRGDEAIESLLQSWFGRVPLESKELIDLLQLSLVSDIVEKPATEESAQNHPYLLRSVKDETSKWVKEKFEELVAMGCTPNEAAAKAIELLASHPTDSTKKLGPGQLNRLFHAVDLVDNEMRTKQCIDTIIENNAEGPECVKAILLTALKYLERPVKEPWNARFRSFKLSNKVADSIACVDGGLVLLRLLGFHLWAGERDFYAGISIGADLDQMQLEIEALLAIHVNILNQPLLV
jgi:thiol-disulfide isomerase/thioredoxin